MCSLISENDKKKNYLERATRAGLKDEQLNAMVNLMWDVKISPKKVGTIKAKFVSEFSMKITTIIRRKSKLFSQFAG